MIAGDEIKVLIVEDHELTRFGLKTAFENIDYISNIQEAGSAECAFDMISNQRPDVVFMDLGLPGINGIEAIKKIKEQDESIKIIVLTSHNNDDDVIKVLSYGINAYCMKDINPKVLAQVLKMVCEGALWIDPNIAPLLSKMLQNISQLEVKSENKLSDEEKIQLTDREKQVLKLIVDGYNNADIATHLCVSIHTAKAHVCSILQKLAVDDRTQAAIKALKEGIV